MTRIRLAVRRSIVAWAALCLVIAIPSGARAEGGDEGERESPPERLSIRELQRMIAGRSDQASIGPIAGTGPIHAELLGWTALGPAPITGEYWSNGNSAGRVSAVLPHPTNPNLLYIAAAQGGVWKTTNGGGSWTPLTDQLSSLASGALAFQPGNPSVLYYGTGEQHFSGSSYYGDGLFRSGDAGATWGKIALATSVGYYIARVVVDPSNPSRILVASDYGVALSEDGGAGWSITLTGNWCTDLVIDPGNSAVLFAALYGSGVWKSVNGGLTWSQLTTGLPAAGFDRINLAIAPSNGQRVFASFVDPSGGLFGMYRTDDGGDNWGLLAATPNYLRTQGWYDNTLVVDPADDDVCYAGGVFPYGAGDTGVIKTVNAGASWTDITQGIDGSRVHPDQHFLAFAADGKLWLGNDGGVFSTSNGGQTWVNRNSNLNITQFYKVGLHPQTASAMIGGTQDNGTVIYAGGLAWPSLIAGDGGPCGYSWENPAYSFSTYVYMTQLLRWNNNFFDGDKTGPWEGFGDRASFCNGPIVFDPNATQTLLAGTYRVWRSTNRGDSWADISPDLTLGNGWLLAMATCAGAPNWIYTGANDGAGGGVIYQTSDAVVWNDRGGFAGPIRDIVVPPGVPATAYAIVLVANGARVQKTIDAGVSWSDVTGDLPPNLMPLSLAIDFSNVPNQIFLGTDYGLYTSANDGVNWVHDSAGLPNCAVYDLQIDKFRGFVVAATHGRGMWRAAIPVSPVGVASGLEEGEGIALGRVIPNPTGLPATIEYRLPQAESVRLQVFDLNGRRVATLVNGIVPGGRHVARWDGIDARGRAASGGVYFFRFEAGDVRQVRRMVLID